MVCRKILVYKSCCPEENHNQEVWSLMIEIGPSFIHSLIILSFIRLFLFSFIGYCWLAVDNVHLNRQAEQYPSLYPNLDSLLRYLYFKFFYDFFIHLDGS